MFERAGYAAELQETAASGGRVRTGATDKFLRTRSRELAQSPARIAPLRPPYCFPLRKKTNSWEEKSVIADPVFTQHIADKPENVIFVRIPDDRDQWFRAIVIAIPG